MVWIWSGLGLVALLIGAVSIYGSLEVTAIPYLAVPYTPQDFGFSYESVAFLSHDKLRLTGWFLPAPNPSDITIIVLHGLGSNAGDMLQNTLCLAREGKWNLFFLNFRGHADSEGRLTSLGPFELKDLDCALAYIKSAKPNATRRLAIYGHSLGAAVSIVGAARHQELLGVAAESPFLRTRRTVSYFAQLFYGIPEFPFMYLALFITRLRLGVSLWDFSPLAEIGKISPRPLFLIHAERDQRMPMADTQALFDAAGEPKELWVVPGAGHGEPWFVMREEFDKRLAGFFKKVFA